MTTDQKIIKNRVGLLELANQLGNVSQACTSWATAGTGAVLELSSGRRATQFGNPNRLARSLRQKLGQMKTSTG